MRAVAILVGLGALGAASAIASAGEAPVIGGGSAAAGKWPDVSAILFPSGGTDQQECTGTLIAPTVVITAGHCYVAAEGLPDNVLIGTTSLDQPAAGETIAIASGHPFPNSQTSEDVTVLVLAKAAAEAPRKIATGWARLDIIDGASVELVGYGAIDKNGQTYIPQLQEAMTTITDAGCSTSPGCNTPAQPAGELGAGGMGIDTCPGDSGGPLYLLTDYGTFLAGVTSRSYDNATVACSEGGIYERPDKIVDWIEMVAGVKIARGPEPTADPIATTRGNAGDTMIEINDPKTTTHTLAISTPPAHGTAQVTADGALRVCPDPAVIGADSVTVTITDAMDATRKLDLAIPITVTDGTAGTCSFDGLDSGGGGGCCDAGRSPAGSLPLGLAILALLRRRR
jgi:endonuclease G